MKHVSITIFDEKMIKSSRESGKLGPLLSVAKVLGDAVGKETPGECYGDKVIDKSGREHPRLTNISHIIKKTSQPKIHQVRKDLLTEGLVVHDYSIDALTPIYSEYQENLSQKNDEEIVYIAISVIGEEAKLKEMTKKFSLA